MYFLIKQQISYRRKGEHPNDFPFSFFFFNLIIRIVIYTSTTRHKTSYTRRQEVHNDNANVK